MSDFLFTMRLDSVLNSPPPTEMKRFKALALLIESRLNSMSGHLEQKALVFEAGATEELAMRFHDFADGDDTSCYEFSKLWDKLGDWGETYIRSGRREKSLCSIPTLPLAFSC